jgi:spore germination cell wall hydrolase CwlJ-like protein
MRPEPAIERDFFCPEKSMTVTEKDRDILARTLWGEARGESLSGQIAVACAIRNRVNDGKAKSWWGEGYAGVCQAPYQFSCWNKNDPNYAYMSGAKAIPLLELAQARIAADQVIDGKVSDPTGGATHYYAMTMKKSPSWSIGATQTLKLGHHIFFKTVL